LTMCIVNDPQLSKRSAISKVETDLLVFLTIPTVALRSPETCIFSTLELC